MFDPYCRRCGCRVLVTPSQFVEFASDELGVTVKWRCTCGALGTDVSGRPGAGRQPTRSSRGLGDAKVHPG